MDSSTFKASALGQGAYFTLEGEEDAFASLLLSLASRTIVGETHGDIRSFWNELTSAAATALPAQKISLWFFSDDGASLCCVSCSREDCSQEGCGRRLDAQLPHVQRFLSRLHTARVLVLDQEQSYQLRSTDLSFLPSAGSAVWGNGRLVGFLAAEQTDCISWTAAQRGFFGSLADTARAALLLSPRTSRESEAQESTNPRSEEAASLVRKLPRAEIHDLNNLLMSVVGTADLLLKDSRMTEAAEVRLLRLRQAAERAREILNLNKRNIPKTKEVNEEKYFLVVDDESLILDLAEEILGELGYKVFRASDGEIALQIFSEHKNELSGVLLDLGIPKLNGRETLCRMRSLSVSVPVILTSGYPEEDLTGDADFPKYAAFIQKPYFPADLIEKVKEVASS
jgi:CheY-like chemotaxis protein